MLEVGVDGLERTLSCRRWPSQLFRLAGAVSVPKGVGDSVVNDNAGRVGLIIRGNGYDGVLAASPGVVPPRMVWPDSVDAVAGSDDSSGGDVTAVSSWIGETRDAPGPPDR